MKKPVFSKEELSLKTIAELEEILLQLKSQWN